MTKLTNEDSIARAFAYFDADGSGYITLPELRAVMKDFHMKVGPPHQQYLPCHVLSSHAFRTLIS